MYLGRNNRTAKRLWLIALGLVLLLGSSSCSDQGSEADMNHSGFSLHSDHSVVTLDQFKGQAVLLFFGYTHCPDICPATMTHVAEAMDMLSADEQQNVQPIFITVDPERDSVEHLAKYVGFFHPKLIGLSGSKEEIKEAAKVFSVEYFIDKQTNAGAGNYYINHTSRLFLLDRNGKTVDIMSSFTAPEDIAASVKKVISR